MASFKCYKDILDDLKDRGDWETRQTQYYKVRHNGLRRRNKPYPGAADMHFPLCDSLLERMKPFYVQQLYATDIFASFVSLKPQQDALSSAVAGWFDYKLKQQSNYECEQICSIDYMLMGGRGVVKMWWDSKRKRLCFYGVDPTYIIVPKLTEGFHDADRVVHVMHFTEASYKRNKNFKKQDDDFIKRIKGRGSDSSNAYQDQTKMWREGITYGQNDDQIVIWEVYEREGDKIMVSTYSPNAPDEKDAIRDQFQLPYKSGEFKHGAFPFVSFQIEIKDKGWYAPRGIVENNAAFETFACKMWNGVADWMDFFNRPTYRAERDVGNLTNVRQVPGQVLPYGLVPNETPSPPVSFDQQLQNVRSMSEYRTQIPDLGAVPHFTPRSGYGGRSATEIDAAVGQSGMSDNMRSRIFRLSLSELYRKAFSIYLDYDKDNLDYIVDQELMAVPDKKALHEEYLIVPNGSADSWNQGKQMQKAISVMSFGQNNPYFNQGETSKLFLELFNPQWVKRLYQDPQMKTGDQTTQQGMEIASMSMGIPVQVGQTDDPVVHIQTLNSFVQLRQQSNELPNQMFATLLLEHYGAHGQQLKEMRSPNYKEIEQQAQPFVQLLSAIAQGLIQVPDNVVPMQQPQIQQPPPTASEQLQAKKLEADTQHKQAKLALDAQKLQMKGSEGQQKAATALLSALTGARSAGINLTDEEINTVLTKAGLPTLGQQVVKQVGAVS